jgi:hypothetical protein
MEISEFERRMAISLYPLAVISNNCMAPGMSHSGWFKRNAIRNVSRRGRLFVYVHHFEEIRFFLDDLCFVCVPMVSKFKFLLTV